MDELCNLLVSCAIESKPKLYDMMIYDFIDLSIQYNTNETEYSFDMNSHAECVSILEMNELLNYMQSHKVDDILCKIIAERYPQCYIEKKTAEAMIDYYIECLINSF